MRRALMEIEVHRESAENGHSGGCLIWFPCMEGDDGFTIRVPASVIKQWIPHDLQLEPAGRSETPTW